MASWRRRLVRGLAVALVGGLIAGGVAVYELTNNAAVRQQVIAQLRKHFVGAEITLGSARLRLLGGITIDNLTLYRRDDPSQTPFLHVPSGVIYHDKERLTEGKLAIRKVKLDRPRFTVVRGADGRWNVERILGTVRPDVPIPTVEVDDGTVILEVAAPRATAGADAAPAKYPTYRLEVRHVKWTMVNDPILELQIQGKGETPAFGPLRLTGHWHRAKYALKANLDLAPIPFGPALIHELARVAPDAAEAVEHVGGTGRLHLMLRYNAGAAPKWWHDLRAEVTGGRLIHRDLPLPMENIALTAKCVDGVVSVESFTATAGPATVALKAHVDTPYITDPFPAPTPRPGEKTPAPPYPWLAPVRWAELTVERLLVSPALAAKLPTGLQKHTTRYQPAGPVGLTCRFERRTSGWACGVHLRPAGMTGRFDSFPYPLHAVRGTLDYALAAGGKPKLDLDLTAAAPGGRPVTIRGSVAGEGPQAAYHFDLTGDGVAIDETLIQALPAKYQPVTRRFHPRGVCDVKAHIVQEAGGAPEHDYVVTVRDGAMCADLFPYSLDGLTGTLSIHHGPGTPDRPRAVRYGFRGQARHGAGRVDIEGSGRPTPDGDRITLLLGGKQVPLDAEMAEAFNRIRMKAVWDMIRPSGLIDFTAKVMYTDNPAGPPDLDLTVSPANVSVQPRFFPYALTGLSGTFQYTPGLILFHGFQARHGPARLSFDGGRVMLLPGGGYYADMNNLRAARLPLDTDLVAALPRPLQTVAAALQPRGTLDVALHRLVLSDPPKIPGPPEPTAIFWDGQVRFAGAALRTGLEWEQVSGTIACTGRTKGQVLDGARGQVALTTATVAGQPVQDLHVKLQVEEGKPNELQLLNVSGRLFGGQVSGQGRVEYGAGVRYDLDVMALGVRLEEAARHSRFRSDVPMTGLANAHAYLRGTGSGTTELEGAIHLRAAGRMWDLPLALALMKIPTLRAPDGTAFEEAEAVLKIHGRMVEVERLDLIGTALSFGGKGEMNLDGTGVKLDLYAVWGHLAQLLPPGVRDLPPQLSKNLLRIRATGRLGATGDGLAFDLEAVPALTDPVRQLVEKVRKRQQTEVRGQKPEVRGQKPEDRSRP